jgi:calcineurin-like phosphoesterase family protein
VIIASPLVTKRLKNRWFISDTHFFHEDLLSFEKEDGHKRRSEFANIEEHNETIVERWNARVKPGDKVRHLGDVALGLKGSEYDTKLHPLLSRLNGRKDLIIGNHDKVKNKILQNHFRTMELWKRYSRDDWGVAFHLTHIPQRLDQLHKTNINVHGHLHEKLMDEPNYINVCCEHTNFAPMHLDEIIAEIKLRGI